jgi:hypothetical protein
VNIVLGTESPAPGEILSVLENEWYYVKLYGGGAALDEILTTSLPAVIRAAVESGSVARWFFIRYADPHDHLRVRFNGPPTRISHELLPQVFENLNPLLASGKLWKIDLDTYEREIERYGGVEGVRTAEDLLCRQRSSRGYPGTTRRRRGSGNPMASRSYGPRPVTCRLRL